MNRKKQIGGSTSSVVGYNANCGTIQKYKVKVDIVLQVLPRLYVALAPGEMGVTVHTMDVELAVNIFKEYSQTNDLHYYLETASDTIEAFKLLANYYLLSTSRFYYLTHDQTRC